jgi:hypothetical protein
MESVTFTHARDRRLVKLPDGSEGKLIYISPTSRIAKVRVGGKHVRIAARDLEVLPIVDVQVVSNAI